MSFRIAGLDPAPFRPLYGLPDAELARHGVTRHVADRTPGFPDRVELRDLEPGETALLLNYEHQPADTPYRSRHAIFVREGAQQRWQGEVGEVPVLLRSRTLSVRAFDAGHLMVDAGVVDGREVEGLIERLLEDPRVAYLHAHYAGRGCFAALVERA
ncbi:MAG TPA: DUF1203 domain-containing protein [Xanthomonadales bacterium]|nr:DUF1203 domain-containing protein [Xanthomonadales bacterium]